MVQIQPLHPISEGPQAPTAQGVAASEAGPAGAPSTPSEYLSYSPSREFSRLSNASCYDSDVALRSKSIALDPVLTKAGNQTWRVMGTVNGRQRVKYSQSREEAEELRDQSEMERVRGAAAVRAKPTRLTQAQLDEAEACLVLLDGSDFTLRDAVKALLRNPPPKSCDITFSKAYQEFLKERGRVVSAPHAKNYTTVCRRLADFLGAQKKLQEVSTKDITAWLESLNVGKKSWKNYRNDLVCVFNWFQAKPRQWVTENPVMSVLRYSKRATWPGPIKVLTPATVRDMMLWLELEHPSWVTFFALATFAGVRPDCQDGEMFKLATAIARDGLRSYFRAGVLHISAPISKDGRARQVPLPRNLQQWLVNYPVTPESLLAGSRSEYAAIRAEWQIPHDGLRHTSMSACAALHGIATAVSRHGNSERVCLDHYLNLYEAKEAEDFYSIMPLQLTQQLRDAVDQP